MHHALASTVVLHQVRDPDDRLISSVGGQRLGTIASILQVDHFCLPSSLRGRATRPIATAATATGPAEVEDARSTRARARLCATRHDTGDHLITRLETRDDLRIESVGDPGLDRNADW